jgi:hypothetical protein
LVTGAPGRAAEDEQVVHLSEHAPLARSFAAQLGEAERRLASDWTVEAPEAGFAEWAAAVTGTPLGLPAFDPSIDRLADRRWMEAPVLACFGFRRAVAPQVWSVDRWLEGIRRLMARDPAPADRNSFLFRPVELLGLALGTVAADADDQEPRRWLRRTMQNHATRLPAASVWSRVLVSLAEGHVGATSRVGQLVPETQFDTALMLWLHLVDETLARALTPVGPPALRLELLAKAATGRVDLHGLAEQSVFTIALRRAVVAAVGDLDLHPSGPAQFVVGLCRKFPLLVMELRRRHNQRPFEIADEYDVQDLLRGILRLHFADVRREEWNPSYGGVQSRSDLLLKPERVVVETKMTRGNLGQRELVKQLIVDKEQYRGHPDCDTLVCFVYDPDLRLHNPSAIEHDLSETAGRLRTLVVVSPQGL